MRDIVSRRIAPAASRRQPGAAKLPLDVASQAVAVAVVALAQTEQVEAVQRKQAQLLG